MFQTEQENSCAAKPKLLDLFQNTQKVKQYITDYRSFQLILGK